MRLDLDDAELLRLAERLAPHVARLLPEPRIEQINRYLTLGDVAKMISTTRKALEMRMVRARQRGELHPLETMAVLVDGHRMWPASAVETWARGGR